MVRGHSADQQFDIDFWQTQGDDAIFAAAWEMICMEKEKYGTQPTFHRDVTAVQRSQR